MRFTSFCWSIYAFCRVLLVFEVWVQPTNYSFTFLSNREGLMQIKSSCQKRTNWQAAASITRHYFSIFHCKCINWWIYNYIHGIYSIYQTHGYELMLLRWIVDEMILVIWMEISSMRHLAQSSSIPFFLQIRIEKDLVQFLQTFIFNMSLRPWKQPLHSK